MKISETKRINLENASDKMLEQILNNKIQESYCEFYNYLLNLFAYREGFGEKDTEDIKPKLKKDSIYGALKYFYEIYRHAKNQDADAILKCQIFVCAKKYPYTHPYTYGKAFIKYENIPLAIVSTQTNSKHKERIKELYEKYLQGKFFSDIVKETKEDTLKNYKEKQMEKIDGFTKDITKRISIN